MIIKFNKFSDIRSLASIMVWEVVITARIPQRPIWIQKFLPNHFSIGSSIEFFVVKSSGRENIDFPNGRWPILYEVMSDLTGAMNI